jgi:hypothetical protein
MELIRNRLKNREYTKKRYLNAGLIPTPEESTISLTDETFLIKLNSIIQENIENSNLGIQFICQEVGLVLVFSGWESSCRLSLCMKP